MARYHLSITHIAVSMLALLLLAAGCGTSSTANFIHVKLDHGPLPALGGNLTLRATVDSIVDGSDAEVVFYLPSGVVITNGQVRQKVKIQKNTSQIYEIQIQLVQPGEQFIQAGAIIHQGGEGLAGGYDSLYLEVSDTETVVRKDSLTPTPTNEGIVTDIHIEDLPTPTPE